MQGILQLPWLLQIQRWPHECVEPINPGNLPMTCLFPVLAQAYQQPGRPSILQSQCKTQPKKYIHHPHTYRKHLITAKYFRLRWSMVKNSILLFLIHPEVSAQRGLWVHHGKGCDPHTRTLPCLVEAQHLAVYLKLFLLVSIQEDEFIYIFYSDYN